ncbi:putative late blight resistance protein homolog R1B-16 [Salvia miltiorrhiza]|uniref:putative late blight resistance protein homolog R1B-16 n=1 Tax=Salvia miltiorrhiza TaxID=226208 RepID=UPI0025AD8E5A|nr:putative late blight resistance protein homolog R1B-16 [Salvia miltiorrhiza]
MVTMSFNFVCDADLCKEILKPDQERWDFDDVQPQLISLLEIATSLKQILEKSVVPSGPKRERLESQIQDAAHEAEDIIESHMVNQVMSESSSFTIYPPDLEQVIQQLHSVMSFVNGIQISTTSSSVAAAAAAVAASFSPAKNTVVGLDQDLMELMDRLRGQESKLEIIPILGMGGIGKTTLARTLYDDQSIASHFDICAWTTISQEYKVRAILLGLLTCINKELITPDLLKQEDNELKDVIYKSLYGRRYLIVLDDMWGADSWNSVQRCFPDNDNHSRIMLTSRGSNVGKDVAGSGSYQHEMNLLTESQSWTLLSQKVFGKAECPAELQGIGRNIASDCGGLPLAIHVIGGLLSETERSVDAWDPVGNNVRSAIAEKDKQFSNILSLSYNHLPSYLKPCFLYMGAFPEDYEVRGSRLMSLWAAEGFAEADEAEGYLTSLVERNLLMVTQKGSNGKPKSYGIHDLLRDLCIRKAEEEKFFHVTPPSVLKGTFYSPRRQRVYYSLRYSLAYSSTRSFICGYGDLLRGQSGSFLDVARLVRVLDVLDDNPYDLEFPTKILQLVNLRYLAFFCGPQLPYEISRFRNLQTLIVLRGMDAVVDVPSEIWEMPELRCLKLKGSTMRYAGYGRRFIREKMQTISTVQLHRLTNVHFFSGFPNIKSLGLDTVGYENGPVGWAVNLLHLHKLEKLRCSSYLPSTGDFLGNILLPPSLRKLTLNECGIPGKFMRTLSQLPHLQVLQIRKCHFTSAEWEATEEDEFSSLQLLSLEAHNLVRWRADESNFPRLRHLLLTDCWELEEIPCSIGEIPTLQLIELYGCSPTAVASAREIQEVQQSEYDNYDLQLRIYVRKSEFEWELQVP